MKTFELSGKTREDLGKKATKAIRKNQSIPAVLYGGKEIVHFEVEAPAVRNLFYSPDIFLVELTIDGVKRNAIIQATQFHPVTDKLLHIDFLEVSDSKPIVMEVPIKLEGLAEGVREGGKLSLEMRKLRIKALYTSMPERMIINVDKLGLGKTIQVGELSFEGLEIMNAKNTVVCAVKLTRAARGAQAKAGK